jgi:AraC-like DNA-binding protein
MALNTEDSAAATMQWSDGGPLLASVVRSLWSLAGSAQEAALPGIIAPDAHVEFVFHLGEQWLAQRISHPGWAMQPAAFVYAASHGGLQFQPTGPVCLLAFRVSPVVATRILRHSLADLWDVPVALDALIGSEASTLIASLRGSPDEERFAVLRQWIAKRLRGWGADDWNSERLFNTLLWRSRSGSTARVSPTLGPSQRSLRRILGERAGLSPKSVQLSGRMLGACALLREAPSLEITEIASRVGFYDHAAFTHAFTSRIGLTPTQFRAEPIVLYEREHALP